MNHKIGLCLAGGGVKGAAHIGAIKALEEKNIKFEYRKFHDLRHTFAVLLLLKGTDIYTIMKLLRHKKIASTEIYLAVLPETKDTSVNKLNDIFKN